jgi:hypothetical protein
MAKKPEETVIPMSRFRRGGAAEVVPEIGAAPPPPQADAVRELAMKPPPDLTGKPKIWCLLSSNSGGKTTLARWLVHRRAEAGAEPMLLAALDPGNRSLATWYAGVEQPPGRDTRATARWLRDSLDSLAAEKLSAVLDFGGGGETALAELLKDIPDLHVRMEEAGTAMVACYPLTPRIDDIFVAAGLEAAGFKPPATMLLLNEGKADPALPPGEVFDPVIRHSAFRAIVARGAQVVWMPALESEVMDEINRKGLPFAQARDGHVPDGATFAPIGGLRRAAVGRWLAMMELRHERVRTWL